jgi:hypothetical protein
MKSVCNGKVAALLAENQLAINCGSNQGVEKGDVVHVKRSVEIRDPDTKETLGSVLLQVVTLRVSLVMDRASVAYVTDRVLNPITQTSMPRILGGASLPGSSFKTLTLDAIQENAKTALVQIGWPVQIERPDPGEADK